MQTLSRGLLLQEVGSDAQENESAEFKPINFHTQNRLCTAPYIANTALCSGVAR